MNMATVNIPTLKLNNGREIPVIGYGTWLGVNDNLEFDISGLPKMMEALSYAIDIGYRHIDTAHFYRIEPEVGQVINKKIEEGKVERKDLFVTTKVWQHFHREADVEVSLRGSLSRMGLHYVDLLLMHWPMSISQEGVDETIDYLETWRGFEQVLSKGLTKSIGVSNFNLDQGIRNLNVEYGGWLVAWRKWDFPGAFVIQIINLNLGQPDLVNLCQSHNVVVVAYSPFGTMVPSRAIENSPEPKIDNPTMLAIAKKHGKTVSQIVLRHLYQRGIVSIPKTVTKSRVLENVSIFDFSLDAADVETISAFDIGYRTVRPIFWQHYTNYPFDIVEQKMDEIPLGHRTWKNGANLDRD